MCIRDRLRTVQKFRELCLRLLVVRQQSLRLFRRTGCRSEHRDRLGQKIHILRVRKKHRNVKLFQSGNRVLEFERQHNEIRLERSTACLLYTSRCV